MRPQCFPPGKNINQNGKKGKWGRRGMAIGGVWGRKEGLSRKKKGKIPQRERGNRFQRKSGTSVVRRGEKSKEHAARALNRDLRKKPCGETRPRALSRGRSGNEVRQRLLDKQIRGMRQIRGAVRKRPTAKKPLRGNPDLAQKRQNRISHVGGHNQERAKIEFGRRVSSGCERESKR